MCKHKFKIVVTYFLLLVYTWQQHMQYVSNRLNLYKLDDNSENVQIYRTEQNRNFINMHYMCASLNNKQQTTYKHKVTLYTLTINTQYIYKQYLLV